MRQDFVEEAFQIVLKGLRREANKKHCDFVKVDRVAACYEVRSC